MAFEVLESENADEGTKTAKNNECTDGAEVYCRDQGEKDIAPVEITVELPKGPAVLRFFIEKIRALYLHPGSIR